MIEYESDPFSHHLSELMTAFKKKKIECASNCLFLTLFTGIVQICKKVGHLTATVDAQGVRGYKGFLWATQNGWVTIAHALVPNSTGTVRDNLEVLKMSLPVVRNR